MRKNDRTDELLRDYFRYRVEAEPNGLSTIRADKRPPSSLGIWVARVATAAAIVLMGLVPVSDPNRLAPLAPVVASKPYAVALRDGIAHTFRAANEAMWARVAHMKGADE